MNISVIIPAHNEEKYIADTIRSIPEQVETIVVANGCTDKTEDVVRKFSHVTLLSLPNAHVSAARNAGATRATGDVLLFLDADTLLSKDSLQKIREQFTEGQSIATTLVKPDENKMMFTLSQGFKNFYNKTGLYKGCSGALICRRKDFLAVGGYPLIPIAEHRKLTTQLLQHGSFTCITTYVTTSMRRYQKWGMVKSIFFHSIKSLKGKWGGDLSKNKYEVIR